MAAKPKRPCGRPGCPELVVKGYCKAHRPPPRDADAFYGAQWQRARIGFLRQHSRCIRCARLATVVDHIEPHRGDARVFWDRNNWQAMCVRCHGQKTATEDRQWG